MIDLKTVIEVVDEINGVVLEGQEQEQKSPISIRVKHDGFDVVAKLILWDNKDGSRWAREEGIETETPKQLRDALLGEMRNISEFFTIVSAAAKAKGRVSGGDPESELPPLDESKV